MVLRIRCSAQMPGVGSHLAEEGPPEAGERSWQAFSSADRGEAETLAQVGGTACCDPRRGQQSMAVTGSHASKPPEACQTGHSQSQRALRAWLQGATWKEAQGWESRSRLRSSCQDGGLMRLAQSSQKQDLFPTAHPTRASFL